jgi:hypothetical protein
MSDTTNTDTNNTNTNNTNTANTANTDTNNLGVTATLTTSATNDTLKPDAIISVKIPNTVDMTNTENRKTVIGAFEKKLNDCATTYLTDAFNSGMMGLRKGDLYKLVQQPKKGGAKKKSKRRSTRKSAKKSIRRRR